MKFNYLIPAVVIIGLAALFFFPEPETNFLAYVGTAFFFIILTIFLIIWQRKKSRA
ncbi:hypothetical protein JXB28_06265 [Candidatus Woesearchaeota archaeon]|nr:hypothetical protein [Candidatus Woesearchaeota archaeon]